MTLGKIPYDEARQIQHKCYRHTKLTTLFDEFEANNTDVMELLDWKDSYVNTHSAQNSLDISARRQHRAIKAVTKHDRVFLVRAVRIEGSHG